MTAIITNKKRSCNASGTSGLIKMEGNVSLEAAAPKVTNFNLTVFVNTATAPDAETFVYAGNANKDGAFNMNLQPDFSDMAQSVTEAVFALITDVETQYAAK